MENTVNKVNVNNAKSSNRSWGTDLIIDILKIALITLPIPALVIVLYWVNAFLANYKFLHYVPISYGILALLLFLAMIVYAIVFYFCKKIGRILLSVIYPIAVFVGSFASIGPITELINCYFDKKPAVITYVELEKKSEDVIKFENENISAQKFSIKTNNYDELFALFVNEDTFKKFNEHDVLVIPVKQGFLGFEYFENEKDISSVSRSLFPEDVKFPLTEEEAKKYLSSKNQK